MSKQDETPDSLLVLGAEEVVASLEGAEAEVLDAVEAAYKAHAEGLSSLPHSSFLRFPDNDRDRIISLPAYLGGDFEVAGVKWIASVPANVGLGIERASAVIVLNHRETGRPFALLEGSIISKQRTAASAALAARVLRPDGAPSSVGLIGCGPIQLEVAHFLTQVWPDLTSFTLFDLDRSRAQLFADKLSEIHTGSQARLATSAEELLASSPVISLATTAIHPHIDDLSACRPGTLVLHVSLRDLAPEIILASHNVVDDLDHVCRARTSIHLASEQCGHRDFVHASLGEVLLGRAEAQPEDEDRHTIFSPFGLGILDLAVARLVVERASRQGAGIRIPSFLPTDSLERGR